METESGAEDGPQIEVLQSIGLKVCPYKAKKAGAKIVVITNAALSRLRCSAGNRSGSIISGEYGVDVHSQVIRVGLPVGYKGESQIFGLAVATRQGETYVDTPVPSLQQARMQGFLICSFF